MRPTDEILARRTDGQKVRFPDLILPKREMGGIIDNPPPGVDPVEFAKATVRKIESKIGVNFGHLFPAWMELLLTKNGRNASSRCVIISYGNWRRPGRDTTSATLASSASYMLAVGSQSKMASHHGRLIGLRRRSNAAIETRSPPPAVSRRSLLVLSPTYNKWCRRSGSHERVRREAISACSGKATAAFSTATGASTSLA